MIVEELLEELRDVGRGRVRQAAVGLGYTLVVMDDGSAGLSHTPTEDAAHECENNPLAGRISGMEWEEVARMAAGDSPVLSAIGIAALNAAASRLALKYSRGDLMDHISVRSGERVCMVGYVPAIASRAREAGAEVLVFELRPVDDPGYRPWWAYEVLMRSCDVAMLSGSTLVNKTADRLLELSSRARLRALVGPSTVMAPKTFSRRGVRLLAGTRIRDAELALRIVSEGGGARTMYSMGAAEKVVAVLDQA
ncbi:MAG: Rossmann-like domain-containing protein [Conexivisphaera sp.]